MYENAVFFIDSTHQHDMEDLKETVHECGGTVSQFLNKDVTHILTSQRSISGVTQKQKSIAYGIQSRAAMILERALHSSQTKALNSTSGDLIARGQTMGIKIVHITTFLQNVKAHSDCTYNRAKVDNSPTTNVRVHKLKPPFIKIEDHSHQFRPLFRQFDKWPTIEDFDHVTEDKEQPVRNKHSRNNYCENCLVHFDNLATHLRSELHKNIVGQNGYYREVDKIIRTMPSLEELHHAAQKRNQSKQRK